MLKQVWFFECDICMHKERADGWKYGRNQDIHLCPDCAKKLEVKL